MKRSIIALMGLFALFACSDEVIQDVDKKSESDSGISYSTNSYTDPNLPGANVPGVNVTANYESPWKLNRIAGISYLFVNNTSFFIEITPYIGWSCKNDEVIDMMLNNDPMNNFPFLYDGGNEYGNVVEIEMVPLFPNQNITFGPSTATIPFNGAVNLGGISLNKNPLTIAAAEETPLMEFGKIYFIEYKIYETDEHYYHKIPIHTGVLKQKVGDDTHDENIFASLPVPWHSINPLTKIPDLMLMYHDIEKEICLVNIPGRPIVPSEEVINIGGVNYTISFTTDQLNGYIVLQ